MGDYVRRVKMEWTKLSEFDDIIERVLEHEHKLYPEAIRLVFK